MTGGRPILASGVDAIDVTEIGQELFGINHDVFASERSLMDDIKLVLEGIRPPANRLAQIRSVPEGASVPDFWKYAH